MSEVCILDKERYKNKLVNLFKIFIQICAQNNLQYFCIGGTLIGAVRHKGMIPWDDDIDVVMPRVDYNKLISLYLENHLNCEIFSMENNGNYYLPYAKFCDKKSSVLEYREIPCLLGVFIDIFPLDGAHADILAREKDYLKYKRLANQLHVQPKTSRENLVSFINRMREGQLRTAWNEIYHSFDKKKKRKQLIQDFGKVISLYSYEKSTIVGNYGGMWGLKEFWDKEWFVEFIMCEFESLEVRIPKHYDKILTQVYGDYMKLPPEDKRVSHHNLAYLNLDKRVSFKEIYAYVTL